MRRLVLASGPGPGRRRPTRRQSPRGGLPLAAGYGACFLLLLVGLAVGRLDLSAVSDARDGAPVAAHVRVIDGDTLHVAGERVRIANIDTPEMPPKARCPAEADGALRARDELNALVAAGPLVLERTGTDRYGRTLANVRVNGADAGQTLIAGGLARPWEGRRRSWCA